MRTLLIAAASALALMAGTAVAQSGGTTASPTVPSTTTSPSTGLSTNGPGSTSGTMNTTPGGGIDRTARTLQKIFQEGGLVNVPVTVINKPGAGGAVSLVYLNQHAGDAHYIAINSPNIVANDINGRSTVKYRDVTPLANLFSEYTVVAVRADSPLRTGQDFVDRLRQDPGSLAVSTPTTLAHALIHI